MEQLFGFLRVGFAIFAVAVVSCSSDPIEHDEPRKISWEEAVEVINTGKVRRGFQSHSLFVSLQLSDGSILHTKEPSIDEIFRVIEDCGSKCDNASILTE